MLWTNSLIILPELISLESVVQFCVVVGVTLGHSNSGLEQVTVDNLHNKYRDDNLRQFVTCEVIFTFRLKNPQQVAYVKCIADWFHIIFSCNIRKYAFDK
jgi:hypothetical protein